MNYLIIDINNINNNELEKYKTEDDKNILMNGISYRYIHLDKKLELENIKKYGYIKNLNKDDINFSELSDLGIDYIYENIKNEDLKIILDKIEKINIENINKISELKKILKINKLLRSNLNNHEGNNVYGTKDKIIKKIDEINRKIRDKIQKIKQI
jgi:hypothetical protein